MSSIKNNTFANSYLNDIFEQNFVNYINVGALLLKWLVVGVIITKIKTRTG